MRHPIGCPVSDRIAVELVEADTEIGFNLVDMAEAECVAGNASIASRVLQDAQHVLADIEHRVQRLGDRERGSFEPLIGELRREIDVAKQHNSSGAQSSGNS